MTSIVASWQATQGTHYADYVSGVISAGLKRWQGDLASDLAQAAAEAHGDAVLSAAESSADARRDREIAGAGLAWATIVGPAWSAAAAAQAAIGALADASQEWQSAIGSAFVGWAMAQAQADADFGIAGAIASATAGNAAAAAGSMFTAVASKAAVDLTRALNAVQTGFVDAATAASVKATKTIAAAETVERKAVAKADVVLAQDLQSAWGTYAAAECGAVILNARERATIGADYKKDVAGAELAAVKAVAPARKTSMVAAAEANGVYHVKVTGVIADLGILGGEIKVEQVKASQSLISPATLKKWLDSLSSWGETTAAFAKGLAQGVANLGNAVQDVGVGLLNVPAASVNFGSWASEKLFFDVPDHMKIRLPYIPSPDWSKGMVTQESDFDHGVSKTAAGIAISSLSMAWAARVTGTAAVVAPSSRLRSVGDVVAAVHHNADVAVELTRRAAARSTVLSGPQAFGTRAHRCFEWLNNRLNRSLVEEGSSIRVIAEEFRDSLGAVVSRRASGSIGADAIVRDAANSSILRIFDLKTHGGTLTMISAVRQAKFLSRFGATASEIFRWR